MYKKIKINLDEGLMDKVSYKINFPLTLVIKECLKELIKNTNFRKKIIRNINNSNNT